ncbi:MAG: valine--tRNA ligase [Henriciella sp.]|jgi:valyl-tRNA synthetase|uniref:valine--tRNA ligase n=1 Tax=Henriciella sp. TaxID=1968823 RepID=UPI000C1112C9|nr:valine--tRNA ligase [Henriciella sp.]MAN73903.1 valine--tRNA ligase [Henriciella sp.]MBF34073.1 valine--tRNA ligase [Hyphomonadaceae bacterium]PHR79674.1 MAG: valine--tRNA ligase [Henriciella sp.]|tara:strand:+ start:381 stop:3377 length:2997 start_codon:yes stop_codon:yes gene_type:complete
MLDQRFDPQSAEGRIYERWEEAGCFRPSGDTSAQAYSVVIPPPNVTGVLHMGHALNNTLQDILVRFERMRGKNVRWQPGTDHAGIATQMVVERQLAQDGNESRASLGREAFIDRVWQWKEQSGGQIIQQLKRLGASCDWENERFTMGDRDNPDDQMQEAVRKVFVDLYNEGLIYRDKRLVNWDPHFQTAISDLEVESRDVKGHMWHFKYPLAGGETYTYVEKDEDGNVTLEEERDYISIATTRPETMLGDGAVAVHPDDERYAPIVGKLCEIPVGPKEHRRLIPIITDDYPDPDFGSGAVKITGAHDENDYGVAQRNNIPMYRLMDMEARMRTEGPSYEESAMEAQQIASGKQATAADVDALNLVPNKYRGLDRYEARKQVVADIDADGLMIEVEDKLITQPFGDRSGVVIEPMLTDQWFVKAEELAKPAIEAVRSGKTKFVPENWTKTYYNWMDNIQPWCISRQLWWGHQVPVWYGPQKSVLEETHKIEGAMSGGVSKLMSNIRGPKIFCALSRAEALAQAKEYYGDDVQVSFDDRDIPAMEYGRLGGDQELYVKLFQDPDVLDTWFSSALWPFSTQGWPENTEALKQYYPTSVLVTAHDIIFFWVARMMMMGLHFMDGEVPFHDVYIHALVLDEKGQKMSKSKGNAMDPLELVDQYGADALRFTFARQAAQGRNIRLSPQAVEGYRNFTTKLWNAARFAEMNSCEFGHDLKPGDLKLPLNRWIAAELGKAAAAVTRALEAYKFNEAAEALYQFIWNVLCDWYIELIKPVMNGEDEAAKAETRKACGWVIDQTLKLLHPFTPFVTEALWAQTEQEGRKRPDFLMVQDWPAFADAWSDDEAEAELQWVLDTVSEIRSTRSVLNVPAGAQVPASLIGASDKVKGWAKENETPIRQLARLSSFDIAAEKPSGAVTIASGEETIALEVQEFITLSDEVARLDKEMAKLGKDIEGTEKKLSNENFVAKAPPEIVEENRERITEWTATLAKLRSAREQLAALS